MSNKSYRCIDCKFFSDMHGQCRKSPPVAVNFDQRTSLEATPYIMFQFLWPDVKPSDWCGAFIGRARTQEPAPND